MKTNEPTFWATTLLALLLAIILGFSAAMFNASRWEMLFVAGVPLTSFFYALTTRIASPKVRQFCQYALALALLVVVLALAAGSLTVLFRG